MLIQKHAFRRQTSSARRLQASGCLLVVTPVTTQIMTAELLVYNADTADSNSSLHLQLCMILCTSFIWLCSSKIIKVNAALHIMQGSEGRPGLCTRRKTRKSSRKRSKPEASPVMSLLQHTAAASVTSGTCCAENCTLVNMQQDAQMASTFSTVHMACSPVLPV